uniref:Uncharacterized protein n=1 Tax=Lepeophtheirus salmonis TaxID=72036 RepID=A0A0K2T9P6_LEPSM
MRSDFRLIKEVSSHTRLSPQQRRDFFCSNYYNVFSNQEAESHL